MIPTTMILHRLRVSHPRSTNRYFLFLLNIRTRCLGFWAKDPSQAHSITIDRRVASVIQKGRRYLGHKLWLFPTSVTCTCPWKRISFLCLCRLWCLSRTWTFGLHRFCSVYIHDRLARFPRHSETFAVSTLGWCMSPWFLRSVCLGCFTQRLLVGNSYTPPPFGITQYVV